jgi:hypothetical protein
VIHKKTDSDVGFFAFYMPLHSWCGHDPCGSWPASDGAFPADVILPVSPIYIGAAEGCDFLILILAA